MNKYEVLYIVSPATEEAKRDALIERFATLVKDNGGEVSKLDKWGMKKLAYPIAFKTEGYYVLMNFTANPDLPLEMERQMRISDDVLRFMVTKPIEAPAKAAKAARRKPAAEAPVENAPVVEAPEETSTPVEEVKAEEQATPDAE